ncbi:MAG: hypothetical protein JJU12_05635 [Chlamydiales bacterium]|nr:hypothetical protein [Chlamydiales bacterium]
MRKSYHKTLADNMRKMMQVLDRHYLALSAQLDVIQLLFLETQYVEGHPLLSERALKTMAFTYSIGAAHLAPSLETRKAFASVHLTNPWFKSHFLFPPAPRLRVGWFTPWRTKVILPKQILENLEREKLQAFLYCPSPKEIALHRNWFEEEQAADSFIHQLNSVAALFQEENKISSNARQYARPIFRQAIAEWKDSDLHSDKIPKHDRSLYELPFAPPREDQRCWQAWQQVVKTIHGQECRHRRGLLAIYRKQLEEVFFHGLDLEDNVRQAYLANFRAQVFNQFPQPRKHKAGRWEQGEIPDCYTASKIIMHICQSFIDNPEEKEWGETALALWVMVWCAQEAPGVVTKDEILSIRSSDLNELEATVKIKDTAIEISDNLALLLGCLTDRCTGRKKQPIFKNLNPKCFERILRQSSAAILGVDAIPVMPSAFLTSLHIYQNIRMPSAQRRAMQNGRNCSPFPRN